MFLFSISKSRILAFLLILLFYFPVSFLLVEVLHFLFGNGARHTGGNVGKWIDNSIRWSMFERTTRLLENKFKKCMGYALPPLAEKGANQVGVHVFLNSWLSHSLTRMKRRQDAIEDSSRVNRYNMTSPGYCVTLKILQPNVGDWYRPIDFQFVGSNRIGDRHSDFFAVLSFDEEQMSHFMRMKFETLYRNIYQNISGYERMELFGLAAVSVFGGIFVSPRIRNSLLMYKMAPDLLLWLQQFPTKCDEKPLMWFQTTSNLDRISVLASSPNHPKLQCAIRTISTKNNDDSLRSLILLIREANWDMTCKSGCCLINNQGELSEDTFSTFDYERTKLDNSDIEMINDRFSVTISERNTSIPKNPRRRSRIRDRLEKERCSSGWLCNRCLRMPFAGTLHSCRYVCRSCYAKTICVEPKLKVTSFIDVKVVERRNVKQKRIPRIVHQTWFEKVTTDQYPHLQRLQNSWKESGWDYRFYTDLDCVLYIRNNFPARFVEAYEAILPGAFKADFFRLLVLLKDGGIYADIDVQLEADLDNFITDDLAFFIPRDVPLDYWPNSNYCLWNGLMGSAPGHPIIAKAIEDILWNVENRCDYNDVERNLCSQDINAHIWKLRSLPILILTGPCALGMSVNSALGQPNILSGHALGWLNTENVSSYHHLSKYYWGDAITLLTDRYDLGELRFVDVDRNLLIASSDQDRITKSPIWDGRSVFSHQPIHYSKSETDIVGEHGVYTDDISVEGGVKLYVSLEQIH